LKGEKYTKAADIYSFGVVIWAIITHQHPFADQDWNKLDFHWDIIEGFRPEIPTTIYPCLTELIMKCWDTEQGKRPTAVEIYQFSTYMQQILVLNTDLQDDKLPLAKSSNPVGHSSATYFSKTYPIIRVHDKKTGFLSK